MDVNQLTELVEQMAVEHSYPGYDVRSLRFGLPSTITKSPARLFAQALQQKSVVTQLVALRWFYDRPGDAKRYQALFADLLSSDDEWVRTETIRTISRMDHVEESLAVAISKLLADKVLEVRKQAAKACGKLGCRNAEVIANLQQAATDNDREVRWKAEKALRLLGGYQ